MAIAAIASRLPAVAATTCRSQWRRDARVLGPSTIWSADATHANLSVPPFCGSWVAFSLGCEPGSSESAPCVTWSVFGSPPLQHGTPLPGASAPTDPQSPKGGSQWRRITRGVPTPRLLGDLQWQLGRSLFGMPARGPSRLLFRMVGSWVAALQLTNGGVVHAVVPCGPRGNSSTARVAVDDWTSCGLECETTPPVRSYPAR